MPVDTSAAPEKPQRGPLFAAIPGFAPRPSQLLDPSLPPVDGEPPSGPPSQSTAAENGSLSDPPAPTGQSTSGGPSRPTTSTDRSWRRAGGDPTKVAEIFAGLFVLAVVGISLLARSRGRDIRQPTIRQRDDVAEPLARIACRHLPMDALGPDLSDGITAVTALHSYALDGPLITRPYVDPGVPDDLDEENP